jgi:hypothetical protein
MSEKRNRRLAPIADTADYLGIATQSLRNRLWSKSKTPFPVKPVYLGRKPLFDLDEIDAYIESLKARRDQAA